jgi:hypothetical protein
MLPGQRTMLTVAKTLATTRKAAHSYLLISYAFLLTFQPRAPFTSSAFDIFSPMWP